MAKLLINVAGDYRNKIICVRHIDIAECCKLDGKFTDALHRHNVDTNVRENRLRNPNLSLAEPVRLPGQRGYLKSLVTGRQARRNIFHCTLQEHVYFKYKQSSSTTNICLKFVDCIFSARHCSRTRVLI
jgi:hypothetical protein